MAACIPNNLQAGRTHRVAPCIPNMCLTCPLIRLSWKFEQFSNILIVHDCFIFVNIKEKGNHISDFNSNNFKLFANWWLYTESNNSIFFIIDIIGIKSITTVFHLYNCQILSTLNRKMYIKNILYVFGPKTHNLGNEKPYWII